MGWNILVWNRICPKNNMNMIEANKDALPNNSESDSFIGETQFCVFNEKDTNYKTSQM